MQVSRPDATPGLETPEVAPASPSVRLIAGRLPGLALAALIALAALALAGAPLTLLHTLGPLTLAMLIGLLLGQSLPQSLRTAASPGLAFARQRLLRLAIVLYGLRISVADLQQVGLGALLIDLVIVLSVFALAAWIGVRWLKLDRPTALLVGAGSAVCGAAAVLATAPALRARAEAVPVAIATVVLFGSCAMLLYPWLWTLPTVQQLLGGSEVAFGRFVGATVHEVAQVAAIAGGLTPEAGHAAVISKLIRVMLLVPLIFVLGAWCGRRPAGDESDQKPAPPWFALLFLLMPLLTSSGWLSPALLDRIEQIDTLLLALAMAALGLDTRLSALSRGGLRPLLLGALLFLFLVPMGLGLSALLNGF